MNTRSGLLLLLGSLAAGPSMPADMPGDAQAQAAMLLRTDRAALSTAPRNRRESGTDSGARGFSAQSQAAGILRASVPASPEACGDAHGATQHGRRTNLRSADGGFLQDAQAQARKILGAESSLQVKSAGPDKLAESH